MCGASIAVLMPGHFSARATSTLLISVGSRVVAPSRPHRGGEGASLSALCPFKPPSANFPALWKGQLPSQSRSFLRLTWQVLLQHSTFLQGFFRLHLFPGVGKLSSGAIPSCLLIPWAAFFLPPLPSPQSGQALWPDLLVAKSQKEILRIFCFTEKNLYQTIAV